MSVKRTLMTSNDVQGAWAIIPTSAKEGAESWRMTDSLDLDASVAAINGLIEAGIDGILSMGTYGEAATLTLEEKKRFMACLVETVAGRVPCFVGTTTLNTRDTIELTRYAADLGADGTMLGLPMWCTPTLPAAVRFYKDVAEACPDMAQCIYANPEAFRFDFPPPFWAQVADIPQVVSAKYTAVGQLIQNLDFTRGKVRAMPIELDYYAASRVDDEISAFWSSGAVCGPEPTIALRDEIARAKISGDWTKAKALTDKMWWAVTPMFPAGGFREFSMYNIAIDKARMQAAGWMQVGPARPPYDMMPDNIREGAELAGRRWAEMASSRAMADA